MSFNLNKNSYFFNLGIPLRYLQPPNYRHVAGRGCESEIGAEGASHGHGCAGLGARCGAPPSPIPPIWGAMGCTRINAPQSLAQRGCAVMFPSLLQRLHSSGFGAIPPRWPCSVLHDLGYNTAPLHDSGCSAAPPPYHCHALHSSGSKVTPPSTSCTAQGAAQPARKHCRALDSLGL